MSQNQRKGEAQDIDKSRGRIFGVLLFLFELGVMFSYGFGGQFLPVSTTNAVDPFGPLLLYTFAALLAILGYGLIISYSKDGTILGLSTTLIVVAVSVQISPLLQSFFFKVFYSFEVAGASSIFQATYQNKLAELSFDTQKIAMILSTSLLAASTSFIGKVDAVDTFLITIIYNIGWPLSFMSSTYIFKTYGPSTFNVFDGYGTNYVYVYAGFFGLMVAIFLNCKPALKKVNNSKSTAFLTLIGTGFVFATLPFTGIIFPMLSLNTTVNIQNVYRSNQGPFNIYFAMTASVIVSYISSAIFGGGKVGVREAFLGTISGGITIAVVADIVPNIGACIAIGAFSGLFSGFWLRVIYPKINKFHDVDHLGLFGPILFNSIFGGFVLAPALYQSFYSTGVTPSTFPSGITDISSDVTKYQLVYFAVALGSGLVFGILAGIVSFCSRSSRKDFRYTKTFSSDFGLSYENSLNESQKMIAGNNYTNDQLHRSENQF